MKHIYARTYSKESMNFSYIFIRLEEFAVIELISTVQSVKFSCIRIEAISLSFVYTWGLVRTNIDYEQYSKQASNEPSLYELLTAIFKAFEGQS